MKVEGRKSLLELGLIPHKVKKGVLLFSEGSYCTGVPYLERGSLRVFLISDSGREINLYDLMPGQMCIIAMLTLYAGTEYPAYTRAEEDSLIYMIPPDIAISLFEENRWWRSLFMRVLSKNLLSVLGKINSYISERVEERLAKYLLMYAKEGFIQKTHEEIARDVGSVRVVVSRTLKDLEREGLIGLCRGKVFIKDVEGLRRRAEARS